MFDACFRGVLTAAFLLSVSLDAMAQRIDELLFNEPGDKITYSVTIDGKTFAMEQIFSANTDQAVEGIQKIGDVSADVLIDKPFTIRKSFCLTSGESCVYVPGIQVLQLPLELERKWTSTFTVTGKNFVNEVTQQRKVESVEKIWVPAGEFECFKIVRSGHFTGRSNKGKSYSGSEEGVDWVGIVRGKAVLIKAIYKNSFGRQSSRELISTTFK